MRAAIYLLLLILTMFIKSFLIAYHTIRGHGRLVSAQRVDWHERLTQLETPAESCAHIEHSKSSGFGYAQSAVFGGLSLLRAGG